MTQILCATFNVTGVNGDVLDIVMEKSRGNPMFAELLAEELIKLKYIEVRERGFTHNNALTMVDRAQ